MIKWMNMPPKHPSNPMANLLLHKDASQFFMLIVKFNYQSEKIPMQVHEGCDQPDIVTKRALKEEAKQTLLKQCYKMATNKYLRLISMGPEGFNKRDWSVVHLNTAISLQFQGKMPEALEKVNEAIRIDPTYEKPYYRRLQILDDMDEQELIFHDNIVPYFIKNPELQKLREDIEEKYRKTIGLSKLKLKLQDEEFVSKLGSPDKVNKFVGDSYRSIFARITEEVGTIPASQTVRDKTEISRQIAEHYRFLKLKDGQSSISEKQRICWLSSFCSNVHKLCIKYVLNSEEAKVGITFMLLHQFWKQFKELFIHTLSQEQIINIFSQRQFKPNSIANEFNVDEGILLILYPAIIQDFDFFIKLLKCVAAADLADSDELTTNSIKFLHTNSVVLAHLKVNQLKVGLDDLNHLSLVTDQIIGKHLYKSYSFYDLRTGLQVMVDKLTFLKRMIFPSSQSRLIQAEGDKIFIALYRIMQRVATDESQKNIEESLSLISKCMKSSCSQNKLEFASLYLCYQIVKRISSTLLWKSETEINFEDVLLKLWRSQTLEPNFKSNTNRAEKVGKYLVVVSMMGYLRPLFAVKIMERMRTSDKNSNGSEIMALLYSLCNVEQILQLFAPSVCKNIVCILGVYTEALACLAVSDMSFLAVILGSPGALQKLYGMLFSAVEKKDEYQLNNSIKLLYSLVVDIKSEQEKEYAQKLGVSEEEVRKAKQLQGQMREPQLIEQIKQKRNNLILQLNVKKGAEKSSRWADFLASMITYVQQSNKEQSESSNYTWMLISILLELAQKQPTHFYLPVFVSFMLASFKNQKQENSKFGPKVRYSIGRFFSIICKSCNVQIFTYTQLQPIVDCLVYLVQHASHELHIFEGLLSLINLSCKSIKVPLQIIETCLLQQNQYVAHASLELLNNLIVNSEFSSKKDLAKLEKIEEISNKYYKYYEGLVKEEIKSKNFTHKVAITNYSHPYKILCTLLSVFQLFMTISETHERVKTPAQNPKIEELEEWKAAHEILQHMSKQGSKIHMTMFKLALYHAEKRTLPGGWSKGLQEPLLQLKLEDRQKYVKIQKYIS